MIGELEDVIVVRDFREAEELGCRRTYHRKVTMIGERRVITANQLPRAVYSIKVREIEVTEQAPFGRHFVKIMDALRWNQRKHRPR